MMENLLNSNIPEGRSMKKYAEEIREHSSKTIENHQCARARCTVESKIILRSHLYICNLGKMFQNVNPIPTGHGRNQPIYERHVTKSGRNRVKGCNT